MTKKYKSLEHTIRNVTSKQPVEENILKAIPPVLGAIKNLGSKVIGGLGIGTAADLALKTAAGSASGTPPEDSPSDYRSTLSNPVVPVATSSSDTTPKPNVSSTPAPIAKPSAVMPATAPKASKPIVMPVSKSTKPKKAVKEEALDEMGFIGTDKYLGNPRAFTRPVPNIEPGKAAKSKVVSGARRLAKQQVSPTMHGKVHEDAESEGTKKRKEIENVGRPDSGNKKLAKQGEIKTKIIDEATLADAMIKAVEKKKADRKQNSMVEFNPKLKQPEPGSHQ